MALKCAAVGGLMGPGMSALSWGALRSPPDARNSVVEENGRAGTTGGLQESRAHISTKDTLGKVTVRDFGAAGDGQSDDTEAIQQAVNSGNGDILFPAGTYRIVRSILIQLGLAGPVSLSGQGTARIVMSGKGPAFRFLGSHAGTADPSTLTPAVVEKERAPVINAIEIVGDHPDASGVELNGTMQPLMTRLTVRKALHGIHLTGRNRNVTIGDCHGYDNRGIGIFLDQANLHQINITGSHISYNGQGGVVVRGGEIRNLQIGSCDIEGNMSPQHASAANVLLDVRNGSVREGAIVGCTLQHSRLEDSANIRLLGPDPGQARKVGHFTIADNAMSDVAVNIHLKHARGVVITGNTIWKGFRYNLLVESSSQIVLGSNLFDRNPDYRPHESRNTIRFVDSSACTLMGLHMTDTRGEAALSVERSCWFNIANCTILDPEGAGVLLSDVRHSRVSGCLIRAREKEGSLALAVQGGEGNLLEGNLMVGETQIDPAALRQER
ncbi:MAG: hypothetical protein GEU99_20295 [Luteitalea sp.]|nr:hypothetical protein [Luteitalea sp.]